MQIVLALVAKLILMFLIKCEKGHIGSDTVVCNDIFYRCRASRYVPRHWRFSLKTDLLGMEIQNDFSQCKISKTMTNFHRLSLFPSGSQHLHIVTLT